MSKPGEYKWFKDFHGGREPWNLMEAISSGEIEYVKKHLTPKKINKPELKRYPITEAVRRNWVECAELLLENGANVNAIDYMGDRPYDIARRHPEGSRMLELIDKYGGEKGPRTRLCESAHISIQDAAYILEVSYPTAVKRIDEWGVKTIRVGAQRKVDKMDLIDKIRRYS